MRLVVSLIAAALLVGAAVVLLWWLLVVAAVYGLYRGARALWSCHTRRVVQARHQRAELLARADLQHRWWLDGDPRGTYGRYTPAA